MFTSASNLYFALVSTAKRLALAESIPFNSALNQVFQKNGFPNYPVAKQQLLEIESEENTDIKEFGVFTEIFPPFHLIRGREYCDHCGYYNNVFAFTCAGIREFELLPSDDESEEFDHVSWDEEIEGFFILEGVEFLGSIFLTELYKYTDAAWFVGPGEWDDETDDKHDLIDAGVIDDGGNRVLCFQCCSCEKYMPPHSLCMEPGAAFFPHGNEYAYSERVYRLPMKVTAIYKGGYRTFDYLTIDNFLMHGDLRQKRHRE